MNIKEQLTLPSLRHRIRSALGVLDFRCSCENKHKKTEVSLCLLLLSVSACINFILILDVLIACYCELMYVLNEPRKWTHFFLHTYKKIHFLTFCLILLGRVTLSLNYSFRSLVLSFGSLRSRFLSQILLSTFTVPNHNNMDKTSLRC